MADDTHVVWQSSKVTRQKREQQQGYHGLCIWFTGLSGSGKSTLANLVEERLHAKGIRTYLLDGDNVRHGLSRDLGFSEDDRKEQMRRVAHVSQLFVDAGVVVMTALISPFEADRDYARTLFDADSFVEVYVQCPLDVCASRDPKGLYEKAQQGEIKNFTGVSSPYEAPSDAEVVVNTAEMTAEECAARILAAIDERVSVDRTD